MLLNASVAKPRPSYLKSYSSVCLPGGSASLPSHRSRFRSSRFQREYRLAFQQIQPVSAEPPPSVTIMPSPPPSGTSISAVIV